MSKKYSGDYTDRVAFPLGGIGAGMVCIEGRGAISHVSVRNQPNVFFEPCVFSAICIKGKENFARVIEGPVPRWKGFGNPGSGNGSGDKDLGLPRMQEASFESRFPFGHVDIKDSRSPLKIDVNAWSPFLPGNSDDSSLPVSALEYTFKNTSNETVEAVYSWNSRNFMGTGSGKAVVKGTKNGLIFHEPGTEDKPWNAGDFCARVDDDNAVVNCSWFRGGWFDNLTMAWKDIESGEPVSNPEVSDDKGASPGGTIFVPFKLAAGEEKTVRLMLSWYIPETDISIGQVADTAVTCATCANAGENELINMPRHKPWYTTKFSSVEDVASYWESNYNRLREESKKFSDCFFDTDLPDVVVEAIEANLTILKSPTVLRQPDGRLWCWEGCCDSKGCCHGSCTHVWNYAQAVPHLFPDLERTLRDTEFNECQGDNGHQTFRAPLPIRDTTHENHACADGQLGGIMQIYREWRISGDNSWLREFWPKTKQSMDYCIGQWDPESEGIVKEPHHNTYDIEFWGPDPMCTTMYLGALIACTKMGKEMGEDTSEYESLYEKGKKYLETELWNGEYFFQKVMWEGLKAPNPVEFYGAAYSPEAAEILKKEGPKYQYGTGCLSDGVIGCWVGLCCGLEEFVDTEKVKSHLKNIHKHNLKKSLLDHVNPQRPSFAFGDEGGTLLCSWPNGDKLSLPFVYSDEVWTGIEYQVAAHCAMLGLVDECIDIVAAARERYDGKKRNPYNEYECGHWYARALASYAILQGLTGARYDAIDKKIYLDPQIKGDFRAFLSTATGYGTVGVKDGMPFVEVVSGEIPYKSVEFTGST